MAGMLDGTGFVYTDMTAVCRNHTLIWLQQRPDDNGIGLGAAGKKLYFRMPAVTCPADMFLGLCTDFIRAISWHRFLVRGCHSSKNGGMGTVLIIRSHHDLLVSFHRRSPFSCKQLHSSILAAVTQASLRQEEKCNHIWRF